MLLIAEQTENSIYSNRSNSDYSYNYGDNVREAVQFEAWMWSVNKGKGKGKQQREKRSKREQVDSDSESIVRDGPVERQQEKQLQP